MDAMDEPHIEYRRPAQCLGPRAGRVRWTSHSTPIERAEIQSVNQPARAESLALTASKMAIEAVCVRPGMSPATIIEAPKSPRARAKASTAPAANPRQAI